jgi:2-polyprenyl-3-methyl-5-hydroxy-6-metoxy-1,4-benzoquinol methylase
MSKRPVSRAPLGTAVTDADALAAFETLLTSQVAPKGAWQPVTDYSFDARADVEGQTPDLILSTFTPKRIVDAGCGFGHLVRLLVERGAKAYGFDLKAHNDWIDSPLFKRGDVTEKNPFRTDFDLVICREVLEHLTVKQIKKAVHQLCAASTRYVYITTRFHPAPQHLLDVATSDGLDPTHISMLNQDFLRTLFVLEGFARRPALEALMDWRVLGRVLVYERV